MKLTLPSTQTEVRENSIRPLQEALSVHPNGHFEELLDNDEKSAFEEIVRQSDDRFYFSRHRLLDIEWADKFPEQVNNEDITIAHLQDFFHRRWGYMPYSGTMVRDVQVVESIKGHSLYSDSEDKSILASWALNDSSYENELFLEKGNEKYWLVCDPAGDLITAYEDTWANRVKAVVRVKKKIRSEDAGAEFSGGIVEIDPRLLSIPAEDPRNGFPSVPQFSNRVVSSFSEIGLPQGVAHQGAGTIDLADLYRGIPFESDNLEALLKKMPLMAGDDLIEKDQLRAKIEDENGEWVVKKLPNENENAIFQYSREVEAEKKLWYEPSERDSDYESIETKAVRSFFGGKMVLRKKKTELELPDKAVCLKDTVSGRIYWARGYEGTVDEIKTLKDYKAFWDQIESLELCSIDVDEFFSSGMTLGRNEARLILEKFSDLDSRVNMLEILEKKYETWLDSVVPSDASVLSDAALKYYTDAFVSVSREKRVIDQQIQELAADAKNLGYTLILAPEDPKTPFENEKYASEQERQIKTEKLERGFLYKTVVKTASWTEHHKRTELKRKSNGRRGRDVFGRRGAKKYKWVPVEVPYTKDRKESYTDWIRVQVEDEPWVIYKESLSAKGKRVYVVEKAETGYITDNGEPLDAVMNRCLNSEKARLETVIFMPEYEETITRGSIITRYHVFERPLPGIIPVGLPVVRIKETLSFRKKLLGNEIGELVKSVNLAPGEKQKLTFSRSYKRTVDSTRTIKSYLDIETADSVDFDDMLEREARIETASSSEESGASESNLSGQYKGSSGGINLSENSTDSSSLSTFNRNFEKVAKKTSKKQKRIAKDDVEVRMSEVSTSENTETLESEVENINDGASLNLFYYQLFNTYASGLFLESLAFQITSPYELIQGTGIFGQRYRSQNEFGVFVKDLMEFASAYELAGVPVSLIVNSYMSEIIRTFNEEHKGLKLIDMLPPTTQKEGDDEKIYEPGSAIVGSIRILENPISVFVLQSLANAYYLDSLLGVNPATEPYSEAMRLEKVKREDSETRLINAKADSLGHRGGLVKIETPTFSVAEGKIQFSGPIPNGNWVVLVDGEPIARTTGGDRSVRVDKEDLGNNSAVIQVVETTRGLELNRG